jgi:hypothetical protein
MRKNIFTTSAKFLHYTKLEGEKNVKSIKIILHGTYLFMTEHGNEPPAKKV